MRKKVAAAVFAAASLAVGFGGVAGAAPAPRCTHAAATMARLQAEEDQVTSVLATLQSRSATNRHEAAVLRFEIAVLTRFEARLASAVSHLQARCPSTTGTGTGSSGGTATGPGGGVTVVS